MASILSTSTHSNNQQNIHIINVDNNIMTIMCKQEILYQIKNDKQNAENQNEVLLTFEN